MKLLAVIGHHNSGKTTFIEELIRLLREKGYRVGYIKHDPKGHGITDREGSDTARIFPIAHRTALSSPRRFTLWEKRDDDPFSIVREHFREFDVVILEGYKGVGELPKVALGDVEADNIVMRVEGPRDARHIIELLEKMEDNL
jgi:molybdopterin-guanine dinucleotide biosynthesis protein B